MSRSWDLGSDLSVDLSVSLSGSFTIVLAQNADFGALTPLGEGGFKPYNVSNNTVDLLSVDDQTGATRTWSINGSGALVANGTPDVDDGLQITCSYAGGSVVLTVNSIASAYSSATTAEVVSSVTAAVSGDSVIMRASLTGEETTLTLITATGVTLTAELSCKPQKITLTGTTGLLIDSVDFEDLNAASAAPSSANSMLVIQTGADGVTASACTFNGKSPEGYGKYLPAIYVIDSDGVTIDSCTADSVFRIVTAQDCGDGTLGNAVQITNNTVTNFVEQAVRCLRCDQIVDSNDITTCISRVGKRLTGTITGTLNVGDSISKGSGSALQGGQIQAVGAGYVDILYNAHEFTTTGTFEKDGSNYIAVTSVTTGYDPYHPDGIQIINNSATRDHILKLRKNVIGRGAAALVDYPNIEVNNAFPGIRIQHNNASYDWTSSEVDQNIVYSDASDSIDIDGLAGGTVKNNVTLYSSRTTADSPSRIRIQGGCVGVDASGNVGDSAGNGLGLIDNGTGTVTTGGVEVQTSDYSTEFPDFDRDVLPHVLADFAPDAAGSVESALAGPITPLAAYRVLAVDPALVTSATELQAAASSNTTAYSIAGDGSDNQVLVVEVALEDTSGSFYDVSSITWNGSNLTQRVARTGGSFNRYQIWTLAIGASSASSAITVNMAGVGNKGIIITAMIVSGVSQSAPTDIGYSPTSWPASTVYSAPSIGALVGFYGDATESAFSSSQADAVKVEPAPLAIASCASMMTYNLVSAAGNITIGAQYSAAGSRSAGGALFLAQA